jgi:uncharacterized protein (TIGR00369 family)
MTVFDEASANRAIQNFLPAYVRETGVFAESVDADRAILRLPFSDKFCLSNGTVCGQVLLSLADTAGAFAICGTHGAYLPMVTIDLTMHFLKPATPSDLIAEARIIRLGGTMAFGTVAIRAVQDAAPVALAQTAYSVTRPEIKWSELINAG